METAKSIFNTKMEHCGVKRAACGFSVDGECYLPGVPTELPRDAMGYLTGKCPTLKRSRKDKVEQLDMINDV